MTSIVPFELYCKNPDLYKNTLSDDTINFLDQLCTASQAVEDWTTKTFESKIVPIIKGFVSSEGILMLSAFEGISLTIKFVSKCLEQFMKGALQRIADNVGTEFAGIFSQSLMNYYSVTRSVTESIEIPIASFLEGGMFMFASPVRIAFWGLERALSILNVGMVLSLIFDSWDPCGLDNDKMGAVTLKKFSDLFDEKFSEALKSASAITTSTGKIVYNGSSSSTIEYNITYDFIMNKLLTPEEKKYYKNQEYYYGLVYYNNLKMNSDGYPINWGGEEEKPLSAADIDSITQTVYDLLSDNNTVVSNWFYKFLPVIIACIIFFIFIFFLIKYG